MKATLILIVAGEASADLHGSNLVRAMRRIDPGITFRGIGGQNMKNEAVDILVSCSEMAVVGLTEVLPRLPTIARAYFTLKTILKREHPDLLILIDYPDFNILLSRAAKRFGVPVLYYISPQAWAWRKRRVGKLRERVARLAVILPFEEDFYRREGLDAEYVGHPLIDVIPQPYDRSSALKDLALEEAGPVIGLLPGSRKEEVINLLPAMAEAAGLLRTTYPNLQALLPRAPTISEDLVKGLLRKHSLKIKVIEGDIYRVLSACDLAFVASGTATLETAIMQVPMVILYRVSSLSYWIGKKVIKVPFIGLPNLIAGKEIVPELIQDAVTPERLAKEALNLIRDKGTRERMVYQLARVREKLGAISASERTAEIAFEMIGRNRAQQDTSRISPVHLGATEET